MRTLHSSRGLVLGVVCALAGACSGSGSKPSGAAGSTGAAGQAGGGAAGAGSPGVGGLGYTGSSRCDAAGVLLCESFEGGLDANTWTTLATTDGTVVVDELHAFRGTKALHVKVINQGHKAAISETK